MPRPVWRQGDEVDSARSTSLDCPIEQPLASNDNSNTANKSDSRSECCCCLPRATTSQMVSGCSPALRADKGRDASQYLFIPPPPQSQFYDGARDDLRKDRAARQRRAECHRAEGCDGLARCDAGTVELYFREVGETFPRWWAAFLRLRAG